MNDLQQIKQRIFEEDKVSELLESLDCEYVNPTGGRYEAQLPDRFGSRNIRSVQVYLIESLPSKVRSKGISGDIFSLVSYILYEADNDDAQEYLHQSKTYICNLFGWDEYLERQDDYFEEEKKDYLAFLRPLQKERKKRKRNDNLLAKENHILNKDTVYSWYVNHPHKVFLDDGISLETQRLFEVMFDTDSQRIVFPIHNKDGDLVSIKGRYVGNDEYTQEHYKYMYLYHFDKMIELYNLHRALEFIKKTGEVIVFESEKSCMKAYQYGFKNTVSICGNEISPVQSFLLRQLDANIVFAFDNDMDFDHVKKQSKQIKTRKCFYIKDTFGLLGVKDSPVDGGEEKWKKIYSECVKAV